MGNSDAAIRRVPGIEQTLQSLLQLGCGAFSTVSFFAFRLRNSVWPEFTVHLLSIIPGNWLYPMEGMEPGERMEIQVDQCFQGFRATG